MKRAHLIHMCVVSDYSAVGHYRLIFPEMCARTTFGSENYSFIESSNYICDPKLYAVVRSVKIQRPYTKPQFDFIEHFLKPMSEKFGFWIVMDIDDCLVYDDIPNYNIAKEAFAGEICERLKRVMGTVDYITTTTEYLRDYYVNKFSIPKDKFIIIPNYLPRWWIGNSYNPYETMKRFEYGLKNRLKVAFVCGGNHYDLKNVNNGIDDFTHLVDWVKTTYKDFDFHFVGGVPVQLRQELLDGKIKEDPMVDIMNYPTEIYNRGYNLWVCPLQENVFNRCKSNIKLIEAWSMGIPIIVQNCECYKKYTPDVFDTADDIEDFITSISTNKKLLFDKIVSGRRIIDEGDNNANNGWWLEKNMEAHKLMFMAPQKTMKVNMAELQQR